MTSTKELEAVGWHYIGDANIEYGGAYFDLSNWPHYIGAIQVIDLESNCGADGLVLIERVTLWEITRKRVREVLEYCGQSTKDLRGKGKTNILLTLAHMFLMSGYYDPANCFPNASDWAVVYDYGPASDKKTWQGLKPDKRETVRLHKEFGGDLRAYIESLT